MRKRASVSPLLWCEVHLRGRRDHHRPRLPVHPPSVDHGVAALAAHDERYRDGVVLMRPLHLPRRERVHRKREGRQRHVVRIQPPGKPKLIDLAGHLKGGGEPVNPVELALDLIRGVVDGLDGGAAGAGRLQPLEGQQRLVGDDVEQAMAPATRTASPPPGRHASPFSRRWCRSPGPLHRTPRSRRAGAACQCVASRSPARIREARQHEGRGGGEADRERAERSQGMRLVGAAASKARSRSATKTWAGMAGFWMLKPSSEE